MWQNCLFFRIFIFFSAWGRKCCLNISFYCSMKKIVDMKNVPFLYFLPFKDPRQPSYRLIQDQHQCYFILSLFTMVDLKVNFLS